MRPLPLMADRLQLFEFRQLRVKLGSRGLAAGRLLCPRLCCKTLFGPLKTNFPACGRGDRIIVRGTTASGDELTGNFGSVPEDTSIGDHHLVALFAEKSLKAIFGVLQHYPPDNGHAASGRRCPSCATTGHKALPESGVGDLGRASWGPCSFAGAGVR
jgi:hypothetical protein